MNIKQLNKRERILAGCIIVVLVLGGYGLLRLDPKYTDIQRLEKQKQATTKRLANMDIPSEPQEEVEDIIDELDDQESALQAIKDSAQQVETSLAPMDSQELKVRISELARDSGVRIRVNEALNPAPLKLSNAKKRSRDSEVAYGEIIPPVTSGWITRLSPGSMFQRPLQRLELDGSYLALRRFIHGLDELPYLVTVVRINIDKLAIAPLRGGSQILKTELILAL
jgi:cell division protein FtsB